MDNFNAANPDVCVTMEIVPGSETDIAKLLTAIRGGAAPDVYLVDRFTVPQRANEGVLAELPDAAAMAGDYLDFAWAETQFQGKTYALPFDTDARALYYNKDLITAAGQDPAVLDIANGAATSMKSSRSPTRSPPRTPTGTTTSSAGSPEARGRADSRVRSTRAGTTPGASPTAGASPIRQPARSHPPTPASWPATSSSMTLRSSAILRS